MPTLGEAVLFSSLEAIKPENCFNQKHKVITDIIIMEKCFS